MEAGEFLFVWRHTDGSIVTFSHDGWACSDPKKATWLNSMNHLTSSVPAISPLVRLWLQEHCHLVEGRAPGLVGGDASILGNERNGKDNHFNP
jgi:hypothetical protein